jgi:hypothetical protein
MYSKSPAWYLYLQKKYFFSSLRWLTAVICLTYITIQMCTSVFLNMQKKIKTLLINFYTILHMIAYEHSMRKHFLYRVVTVLCYNDKNCIFLSFRIHTWWHHCYSSVKLCVVAGLNCNCMTPSPTSVGAVTDSVLSQLEPEVVVFGLLTLCRIARRLWVRFPMVSLEFSIDVLPATLWPWGWLSPKRKWVPGIFLGE